jgi:hypothetical protein
VVDLSTEETAPDFVFHPDVSALRGSVDGRGAGTLPLVSCVMSKETLTPDNLTNKIPARRTSPNCLAQEMMADSSPAPNGVEWLPVTLIKSLSDFLSSFAHDEVSRIRETHPGPRMHFQAQIRGKKIASGSPRCTRSAGRSIRSSQARCLGPRQGPSERGSGAWTAREPPFMLAVRAVVRRARERTSSCPRQTPSVKAGTTHFVATTPLTHLRRRCGARALVVCVLCLVLLNACSPAPLAVVQQHSDGAVCAAWTSAAELGRGAARLSQEHARETAEDASPRRSVRTPLPLFPPPAGFFKSPVRE